MPKCVITPPRADGDPYRVYDERADGSRVLIADRDSNVDALRTAREVLHLDKPRGKRR